MPGGARSQAGMIAAEAAPGGASLRRAEPEWEPGHSGSANGTQARHGLGHASDHSGWHDPAASHGDSERQHPSHHDHAGGHQHDLIGASPSARPGPAEANTSWSQSRWAPSPTGTGQSQSPPGPPIQHRAGQGRLNLNLNGAVPVPVGHNLNLASARARTSALAVSSRTPYVSTTTSSSRPQRSAEYDALYYPTTNTGVYGVAENPLTGKPSPPPPAVPEVEPTPEGQPTPSFVKSNDCRPI